MPIMSHGCKELILFIGFSVTRVYIDDFFLNGNIFLSSFKNFKKYDDEMQGDKTEGQNLVGGFNGKDSSQYVSYEGGINAYVLCATNFLNVNVIKDFKGICAIKIKDSVNFGKEIARKLPFVNTGIEIVCLEILRFKH